MKAWWLASLLWCGAAQAAGENDLLAVAISADGAHAFAKRGHRSDQIHVWSIADGAPQPLLSCEGFRELYAAPGYAVIAAGSKKTCLFKTLDAPPEEVRGYALPSRDGATLVAFDASFDQPERLLRTLSLPALAEQSTWTLPEDVSTVGLAAAVSADGARVAFVHGFKKPAAVVRDARSGEALASVKLHPKARMFALALSPDGALLAIGNSTPGEVSMVDVASGKTLWKLPNAVTYELSFNADGSQLRRLSNGSGASRVDNPRQAPRVFTAYAFDRRTESRGDGVYVETKLDGYWRSMGWTLDDSAVALGHTRGDVAGPQIVTSPGSVSRWGPPAIFLPPSVPVDAP